MNEYASWPTFPAVAGFTPLTATEARSFAERQNQEAAERKKRKDREHAARLRAIEEQGRQARRHESKKTARKPENRHENHLRAHLRRSGRAKLRRQAEEAKANRTPEEQKIIDNVKRTLEKINELEASARAKSTPTRPRIDAAAIYAERNGWGRAFKQVSSPLFSKRPKTG